GNDVFVMESSFAANGTDTITDYQAGDTIDLSAALDLAFNVDTLISDTDADGILDTGDGVNDAFDPTLYVISDYVGLDDQGNLTLVGSTDVWAVVQDAGQPVSEVSISIDGYTFTLDAVFPPTDPTPSV
ncbi:MAG: hypothetical protein ACKOAW_03210, partial [Actinomycetota bacterium]